jgi:predicted Zn finger-like uncharacterized protein
MSISANCPDCGAGYNLDAGLAGKRVRCQKCEGTFAVPMPEAEAAPLPRAGRSSGVAKRRRSVRKEGWEDRYEGEEESRGGDSKTILWIVAGVGGFFLLIFLICGGTIVYFSLAVKSTVDNAVETAQAGPSPPPFPAPFPGVVLPPRDVNEALGRLRNLDPKQQKDAASWLSRQPVDPGRQAEVAGALEPLLSSADKQLRAAAAGALEKWATANNVPALVRAYKNPGSGFEGNQIKRSARNALVRLKDRRGAQAIAPNLVNIRTRFDARRALEQMGPIAEDAALPYVRHAEWQVAIEACRVLAKVGTAKSLQTLEQELRQIEGGRGSRRILVGELKRAIKAIQGRTGR